MKWDQKALKWVEAGTATKTGANVMVNSTDRGNMASSSIGEMMGFAIDFSTVFFSKVLTWTT